MHQMTFSFSPGTDIRFTGNGFCSYDDPVSWLIHILHFFMTMSFTNPQKKKSRGVKSEGQGSQGMGLTLPMQHSGSSLSRKAWTWWDKWGGAPCSWETVLTGIWHKV